MPKKSDDTEQPTHVPTSDGSSPTSPPGLLSFVRPPHPSPRWHSSREGSARSLHLTLCRTPSACSEQRAYSRAAGWSVAVTVEPVSLETLWRRPSSGRRSQSDGTY